MSKVDEQQTDESKRRAKKADIVAMQERFSGILRICEIQNGGLTEDQVDIVKKIAEGQTLEQVALSEGWRVLGLPEDIKASGKA